MLILPLTRAMNRVPSVCEAMQTMNGVRSNGLGYGRLGRPHELPPSLYSSGVSQQDSFQGPTGHITHQTVVEELCCKERKYILDAVY